MQMDGNDNSASLVFETSLLLVKHFRNILALSTTGRGFHTRIFSHALHPEVEFVFAGKSVALRDGENGYPEHVVPCAVMISEIKRLIGEEHMSDEEIASLLQKHWKIALIAPEEQQRLDSKDGMRWKDKMPPGWVFESGNTFARLEGAGIRLASAT